MNDVKVISTLMLLVILFLCMELNYNSEALKTGDISFISFDSKNNDGFSILVFVNLLPHSKIRFTDSEWNGNHFGFDESDILWETGNTVIQAGTVIDFTNLDSNPSVTNGTVFGSMNLSAKGDAIFAYTGNTRMPSKFLAAVSNDKLSYGTLLNTNLLSKNAVITYPNGTTFALYKGSYNHKTVSDFKSALNDMKNYYFKQL